MTTVVLVFVMPDIPGALRNPNALRYPPVVPLTTTAANACLFDQASPGVIQPMNALISLHSVPIIIMNVVNAFVPLQDFHGALTLAHVFKFLFAAKQTMDVENA